MLEGKDLTEEDVCKRYELMTKSTAVYGDILSIGDIVIAIAWYEDINAMQFKLEDKIYGDWFYLSKRTKLKEL
jgi:spermidine/putrescine-binding protein